MGYPQLQQFLIISPHVSHWTKLLWMLNHSLKRHPHSSCCWLFFSNIAPNWCPPGRPRATQQREGKTKKGFESDTGPFGRAEIPVENSGWNSQNFEETAWWLADKSLACDLAVVLGGLINHLVVLVCLLYANIMFYCTQHTYVMLHLGWAEVGWANNVMVR